ncbi:MAG: hypothetical protein HQL10_08515 [Nitrospirae bacterium]|nr:hypothetical protein [Nitrospirota bacterium]
MEVKTSGSELTITGNIKSIEDYLEIKKAVRVLIDGGAQAITVKIPESLSMTSSVIGFFLKLVRADNIKIDMFVKDDRLMSLLDTLNLTTIFNIRKM